MIPLGKRQAVIELYHAGRPKKEISRLLKTDLKTVKRIIISNDASFVKSRKDTISIDESILKDVYNRCDGYIQRMHEVLTEEHNIKIGYSTLTQKVRELGIGEEDSSRSFHVDDIIGEEMQHDTSPYNIFIGGKENRVICSGLYLRYSKMRYIKFYQKFNRFAMKCFMDEALRFFGHCAKTCIIDNTNLAVLYGTGPRAVFNPEMVNFSKNYGFEWKAHEVRHSDRKAGTERNFWTTETNFIPGRSFTDIEDLNKQAFEWATERYAKRPQAKTKLIPIQTFEIEKPYLVKLPEYISSPYREHYRELDCYGYAAFEANFYWVPEYTKDNHKIKEVKIIEYAEKIVLVYKNMEPLNYTKPKNDVRNEKFTPNGIRPVYQPKRRKKSTYEEETALRGMGKPVCDYVDFIKSAGSRIHYPGHFLRQLYLLLKKMAQPLLEQTLERALKYRVNNIETITRIAAASLKSNTVDLPAIEVQHDYMEREAYNKGRFCEEQGFDSLGSILKSNESKPSNNIKE